MTSEAQPADDQPWFSNGDMIADLRRLVRARQTAVRQAPELLRTVLRHGSWRDFTTKLGEQVTHDRFEDFLTDFPPRGLGISVSLAYRIAGDDPELCDLLDREVGGVAVELVPTIQPDNPAAVATTLRRHLTAEQLDELKQWLFDQ